MSDSFILHPELDEINELIFKPLELIIKNVSVELESKEYTARRFELNYHRIVFRKAKITPTKMGQFVTLWKRNDEGITAPFDVTDDLDFCTIAVKKENQLGIFVFSKEVMLERGILSSQLKGGKRGIRVYPN